MTILYFCTSIMCSQNRFEKRIDASGITTIAIKLSKTSKLVLKTSPEANLKLSTMSEGEYGHQIVLVADQQDENKITISDALQPTYENYNDKLSAHKVYAVTTIITIPKNMLTTVEMTSGKIALTGHYKQLFCRSDSADIDMSYSSGDTTIASKTGRIQVDLKKTAIKSVTNTDISTHIITEKGNKILLNTVLGRILIIK